MFISRCFHHIFALTFCRHLDHNGLRENFALEEYFHARSTLRQVNQGHVLNIIQFEPNFSRP